MEKLTVGSLKQMLKNHPVIIDAVKGFSDDTEIQFGDIMIVPDSIAGASYGRKWLAEVIKYNGRKGTNEEIELILGSCDFDDLIMKAISDAAWNAADAICTEVFRE